MDISLFLAKIIGLYLIVDGLVVLLRHKELVPLVDEFRNNRFAVVFCGLIVFLLGILVTTSHNIWTGAGFQIAVTIIGWLLVIKGLVVSIMPQDFTDKMIVWVNKPVLYKVAGIVAILVGVWLSTAGFTL